MSANLAGDTVSTDFSRGCCEASITFWTRIEPYTRLDDIEDGLQARLHDPLWLLARQWQTGEFQGEDAGTPVQARVRLERTLADSLPGTSAAPPSRIARNSRSRRSSSAKPCAATRAIAAEAGLTS